VVHEPGHALRLDDNLELLDITDVVRAPDLRRPPKAAVAAATRRVQFRRAVERVARESGPEAGDE
jgi:hypothetical protein